MCIRDSVGSIMGALAGIEGIDAKWITPINDLILSSSLLGSENIDTISHTALRFAAYGAKLHQIEIPEKYQAELDSSRQLFRFYPVSYTHLDVYKRQRQATAVSQRSATICCIRLYQLMRLSLIHI